MSQLGLVHVRLGVREQLDLFSEGDRPIALHFVRQMSHITTHHSVLKHIMF